jgi:hypothetical protein
MQEDNDGLRELLKRASTRIFGSINFYILVGLVAGIAVVIFLFYLFWHYLGWTPSFAMDQAFAQSLVVGIIQIQAGILAIAISFSILYLQVSVEAYSLRASRLLMRHRAFRQMVRDYVFLLSINGLLALFVTDIPPYFPLIIGLVAIGLLLGGIIALLRYIGSIAIFITPEELVKEISRDFTAEVIYKEAMQELYPKDINSYTKLFELQTRMITFPTLDQLGDGIKLFVDIARKMIVQGDHMVLRFIVARISGLGRYFRNVLPPLRDVYVHFDESSGSVVIEEDTPSQEERQKEELSQERQILQNSVYLSYILGGLLHIWDIAVRGNDKASAQTVVTEMGKLLEGQFLYAVVHRTDVLNSAVFNILIRETSKPTWIDMRPSVINMVSNGLDLPSKTDLEFRNYHVSSRMDENIYARKVYTFFENVLYFLSKESPRDSQSIGTAFDGMEKIVIYGASSGSAMIGDFSWFLGSCLDILTEINTRWLCGVLEQVGVCWLQAASDGVEVYVKGYPTLFTYGIDRFIAGRFAQLKEEQSTETIESFMIPFYDMLEKLSIECVKRKQYESLELTLDAMYDHNLVVFALPDPWYPIACITKSLETAAKEYDKEAVEVWLNVSKSSINILYSQSPQATSRLFHDLMNIKRELRALMSGDETTQKLLNEYLHLVGDKVKEVKKQDVFEFQKSPQIKDWKF